jgi:uncharacterized protein YndB with AHSA1/START domain
MTDIATLDDHGVLTDATTLQIQRLLPGPIERIWAWLTESDLRRRWLASGEMEEKAGAPFELVWRNDELTDPPGQRPEGFGAEHRLQTHVIAIDPPHSLTFAMHGEVTFALEPRGDEVLLTVTHRRVTDRTMLLNVSAGWHMHLDVLAARVRGTEPAPFWDGWARLKQDYAERLPG